MNDVEALRQKLGLPAAPLVLDGLSTAARFFRTVLYEDPLNWDDCLRGIDFHKPMRIELLPAGTNLTRHQSTDGSWSKPFVYFTKPGTSPTATGTTFRDVVFERYRTVLPTIALASTASPISFGPTDRVNRMGGGSQYIIAARKSPPRA